MAQEKAANTAVPKDGDHDRVAMLSLRADGTPDQYDPEIIGDKDFAVDAAKRQFAEQAVSAKDAAERSATDTGEEVGQDPSIAEAQKEHDKVASAAEKRAESVVNSLHQG
jgi:hypothetical protein